MANLDINQTDLNEIMFNALLDDKAKFVDLFLGNGIDIQEFLTIPRLHILYKTVVISSIRGPIATLLKRLLVSLDGEVIIVNIVNTTNYIINKLHFIVKPKLHAKLTIGCRTREENER